MSRTAFITIIALALTTQVMAQETRTVIDDTGTEVTFPANPQRIVTGHDIYLTLPLLEMGVMPVGSHGWIGENGEPYIRASRVLTGIDYHNSDIEFVGARPIDVELVAKLNPDVIFTTTWQPAAVDQLRAIAPTVVFDSTRDNWEIYAELAEYTGKTALFEQMQTRYQEQIAQIKALIPTSEIMVSTIHANADALEAGNPYGNLDKVLVDAGFQRPELIETIPEDTANVNFSPELLQQFDGDFIITSYRWSFGATPQSARADFEKLVPGYCEMLHACRNGQMLMVSREEVLAGTFDALGTVAYMILSEVGGHEFVPMER